MEIEEIEESEENQKCQILLTSILTQINVND